MSTYNYNISNFENGYEIVQLCKEIDNNKTISQKVLYINADTELNNVMITFENPLTDAKKQELDIIIANHIPKEEDDEIIITNNIDLVKNLIKNMGYPIDLLDATNKGYVDQSSNNVHNQSKSYTDQSSNNILKESKNYINKISENILQDSVSYTDENLANTSKNSRLYTDQSSLTALQGGKNYTDQSSANILQKSKNYTNQVTQDIVVSKIDIDESKFDINKLSGQPDGDLVGTSAVQTLTNKKIDANNNLLSNISNTNIKANANIDVSKLGNGNITNTEFGHLSGLTNNVQHQINVNTNKLNLHSSDKENPHNVTKQQIGLGLVDNIKCNFNATVRPSEIDDIVSGYSVGSRWINKITGKAYICTDNKEIKAVWIETTSQGELIQIQNIGDGIDIYSNKVDQNYYFKSIKSSDNITLISNPENITIKSKDSHSFLLSPIEIVVPNLNYVDILCFPWLNSEFGAYVNGKLIFEVVTDPSNSLSIRINNITENSILAELNDITESNFYELQIANPSKNSRIKIQVKKSTGDNDINPKIFGIILKYET